jgi:GT2 family glycosyltransferase
VIVSWNARDYLAQCLESLFADPSNKALEVIVVDNASTDGSPEMVAERFGHVRLIRNERNLGFARANNIGIREATGRYVALINSDVRVLPGCLAKLVAYCESHLAVGMAGPRITGGDGKLQRSCRGFPSLWNMFSRALALDAIFPKAKLFGGYLMPFWAHDTLRPVDILSGCFWLGRRQAMEEVGLLDESFFMYGEDMDWCKRFWSAGWELVFIPEAEAIHYGGASSANSPVRFFIEKQRADLQYWRKHHGGVAAKIYLIIACLYHLLRVAGYAGAALTGGSRAKEARFKLRRSLLCVRWMLTRKELSDKVSERSVTPVISSAANQRQAAAPVACSAAERI